jgi:hypothetical protein
MTAGTHYFFLYTFKNGQGESPFSDVTEIALADYPQAPTHPTKRNDLSTINSIYLEW